MLNELYEYKQYTSRIITDANCLPDGLSVEQFIEQYGTRLGYRRIVTGNNLNGLKRPMLIIARACLTNNGEPHDISCSNMEKTVACLSAWCGIDKKTMNGYENDSKVLFFKDFLPNYIKYVLGHNRKNKAVEIDNVIADLRKMYSWAQPAFDYRINTTDQHGLSFEKIVAEALVCNETAPQGLDRYYLLADKTETCRCENDIFQDIYWKNREDSFTSDKESKNTIKRKNRILMMVAFKLAKKRIENSRWFVKADFDNWIHYSSGNQEPLSSFRYKTIEGKRQLFLEKSLISTWKDKELQINENWFNFCGWRIVTKEELLEKLDEMSASSCNNPPVFYRDYYFDEDGVMLQENKLYREEKEWWKNHINDNPIVKLLYEGSYGEETSE